MLLNLNCKSKQRLKSSNYFFKLTIKKGLKSRLKLNLYLNFIYYKQPKIDLSNFKNKIILYNSPFFSIY